MRILVVSCVECFRYHISTILGYGDSIDMIDTKSELEIKLAYNGYSHIFINSKLLPIDYKGAKVIAVATHKVNLHQLGADDLLIKPFSLEDLRKVLQWQK